MINIGDKVVYPMHGAGLITGIENNDIDGVTKSYYVLQLPLGSLKILLPVDNIDNLGLREIISVDEVSDVEDVLRSSPEYLRGSWNKRFTAIIERLESGDILDAAAVTRNLTVQHGKRKISSGERRLLELARQILVSELVFVLDKSPEEILEWINEHLNVKHK